MMAVYFNVLDVGDPNHDMNLRNHLGYQPTTQKGCAEQCGDKFCKIIATAIEQFMDSDQEDIMLVFCCRKERHRSVACRALLNNFLEKNKATYGVEVKDGPQVPRYSRHM